MTAPYRNHLPAELAAQILERDGEQMLGERLAPSPPVPSRFVVMPANDAPIGSGCRFVYTGCRITRDRVKVLARCYNRGELQPQWRGDFEGFRPHDGRAFTDEWLAIVDTSTIPAPDSLSPAVRELLIVLGEEAAEVTQETAKGLRFGMRRNPYTGVLTAHALEKELGDVLAIVERLHHLGVIDRQRVMSAANVKLAALADDRTGRLQYANDPNAPRQLGANPAGTQPEPAP